MKILKRSLSSLVTDIAPITVSYMRMKWIAKDIISDSENVVATRPMIDLLRILVKFDHGLDAYR